MVTRPRRRTRRLQCDVSGATLTEIEGPGKSGGAYGGGGGKAGERGGGRDPGGGGEEGQFVCDDRRGRPGRGDVTHPPRRQALQRFFLSPGILSFPFLLHSAVFSPSRTRWAVVSPEAGRLLGRGGVTTSRGPARSQPKRGNRWLLAHADGHGDFKRCIWSLDAIRQKLHRPWVLGVASTGPIDPMDLMYLGRSG